MFKPMSFSAAILFGLALGAAFPAAAKFPTNTPLAPITPASCLIAFKQSPAYPTCKDVGTGGNDSHGCRVQASCKRNDGIFNFTSIDGLFESETARLRNCDGQLKLGGC